MIESSKGRTCHLAFSWVLEESGDTASAMSYLVNFVQVEHANMMHMPFPIGLSPPRGRGVASGRAREASRSNPRRTGRCNCILEQAVGKKDKMSPLLPS